MNFRPFLQRASFVLFGLVSLILSMSLISFAQDRDRVIKKENAPVKKEEVESRPTVKVVNSQNTRSTGLTNQLVVVKKNEKPAESLVKKTSSSSAVGDDRDNPNISKNAYSAIVQGMMMQSIRAKMGIRYRYGSQGPNSYDCSGFVWKVFGEAGIDFTRTSAASFWNTFDPVYGKDRYKFGTLVFFNRLGHVGIVADENGFYHASTSKGVTYSPFAGYWEKRIVGFRRVPIENY
ncbi:MAG: C40 family peptidase [Pyrinomonadaceae bacterium]